MAVKISHIIIPVKSVEEAKKAKDFFVNVIGLHTREWPDSPGEPVHSGHPPGVSIWNERGMRFPDHILHLLDDYGMFVDIVVYNNRPTCFAKGVGSGKGCAIAFQVPDIKKTWGKLKDYPVQPVYDPKTYTDETVPSMRGGKEPWMGEYFAFCALNMGRVSEDGEEQIIELCEMKK